MQAKASRPGAAGGIKGMARHLTLRDVVRGRIAKDQTDNTVGPVLVTMPVDDSVLAAIT